MQKSVWRDLVVSMLAVYQYSLEKVDVYAKDFDKQGFFDPIQLIKFNHEEIFICPEKSGYCRVNLNAIFTERLLALGEYVSKNGKAHCENM